MSKFTHFDAADYLDSNEAIAAYLTAALKDEDPDMFLIAVKDVARARGMSQLAKDTGLGARACTRRWLPEPSRVTTPCLRWCARWGCLCKPKRRTFEFNWIQIIKKSGGGKP